MKKRILLIFGLLAPFALCIGQVGVNTRSPQGVFHVDGKGDTSGNANVTDDVIVSDDGSIGLGTNLPTASVDVRGSFRYVDGNQTNYYMLQTDASGNAKWAPQSIRQMIVANEATGANGSLHSYMAGMTITAKIGVSYQYMKISITLPPGTWQVSFNATFSTYYTSVQNIWWDLSTSNTINDYIGRVLSTPVGGTFAPGFGQCFSPVTATYIVNTAVTTTYYVWASTNTQSPPDWIYSGEGRMWALPIN